MTANSVPSSAPASASVAPLWSKVPEITLWFWLIKVLTTGMGEALSDFLAHTVGPVPAVLGSGAALLVALAFQLRARRYVAWVYWLAVLMVSVFGTVAADVVHVGLGVPYLLSTIFFSAALLLVFRLWYRREGSLSIHGIHTRRREMFYWATVLTTFALGTAAGDMTAHTLNLGWLGSAALFAVVMLLPTLSRRVLGLGEVLTFWWAYILTRPLGASVADWLAVTPAQGGLGYGTGPVSLGFGVLILVLVAYLALTRQDTEKTAD